MESGSRKIIMGAGFLAALALIFIPAAGRAEEFFPPGRTGIGFRQAFFSSRYSAPTELSLKFKVSDKQALSPYLGFNLSADGNTAWGLGLGTRIYFDFVKEKQIEFFGLGGVGLLVGSSETTAVIGQNQVSSSDTYVGFDFLAGFGTEFFLSGIPNLGFSLEAGLDFSLVHQDGDNFIEIGTVGQALNAGIHYYFK